MCLCVCVRACTHVCLIIFMFLIKLKKISRLNGTIFSSLLLQDSTNTHLMQTLCLSSLQNIFISSLSHRLKFINTAYLRPPKFTIVSKPPRRLHLTLLWPILKFRTSLSPQMKSYNVWICLHL